MYQESCAKEIGAAAALDILNTEINEKMNPQALNHDYGRIHCMHEKGFCDIVLLLNVRKCIVL